MKKIAITKNIKEATGITHGGTFHADEVFATLILGEIFDEVTVCRVTKVPEDISEDVIVYDIGGGEFDHHQRDAECRDNGIKFAAFGLLWRRYGMQLLQNRGIENAEEVFNLFERAFVLGIDAVDNGQIERTSDIQLMSVSGVIASFNPNWDEATDPDECFLRAVETAKTIFDNALNSAISKVKAKGVVVKGIENSANGIMVFDQFVPWQEYLFDSDSEKATTILYVVFPSNRGGFTAVAVPTTPGGMDQRKPFPEEWAGLSGKDLQEVTGVATATFCHRARFICAADTLEDMMRLVKKAVEA